MGEEHNHHSNNNSYDHQSNTNGGGFQASSEITSVTFMGELVDSRPESRILGLKLKKTPSLVQSWKELMEQHEGHDLCEKTSTSRNNKAKAGSEKQKPSNFPITSLRIGTWQRNSRNEGDLTAKVYFAKKRLVWEFLEEEERLKRKIEMHWDDITAIKASTISHHNIPQWDILDIQLGKPPWFFKETTPQPGKHTNWERQYDFTGGEATKCRIHRAIFNPGVLERRYKQLLESDKKLFELSRKPFPSSECSYFPRPIPLPQPPPPPPPPFQYHYPYPDFNHTNNLASIAIADRINYQFVMNQPQPCHNGSMIINPLYNNITNPLTPMMMPSSSTSRAITLDNYSNGVNNGPNQFVGIGIDPFLQVDYYQTSDNIMQSFQSQPMELPPCPESNINLDDSQTQPLNWVDFSEINGVMETELDNFIQNPSVVGYIYNPQQYQNPPCD